jgi:hypothetical protein
VCQNRKGKENRSKIDTNKEVGYDDRYKQALAIIGMLVAIDIFYMGGMHGLLKNLEMH